MTTHQARFTARRTSLCRAVLAMVAFLGACQGGDGPASAPDAGGPLQLVVGGGVQANEGALLEAIVSYTSASGARIVVARDSAIISTGGSDATLRISANATTCFRDAPSGGAASCTMDVTLILRRDGRLLDEAAQQVAITPGMTRVDVPSLQLFEVATVRIDPGTVSDFEPGDTRTFTAVALDRSGLPVAGRTTTWQVVSGGVTLGGTGEARAVTPGPARIRVQLGGRSTELGFEVRPPSVATLVLAPVDTLITAGTQALYRVVARAGNGDVLAGRAVTFTSTNTAVATVSASGTVTGVAPGQSTITVRSADGRAGAVVTASAVVRVEALPVITVTPSEVSFVTEIGQPLPAGLALSVRNGGGGSLGTLSIVSAADVTATLDRNTEPATLTVRPATALPGGGALTRLVRVHSSVPGVADAVVSVTLIGRVTPVASVSITPAGATLVIGQTSQFAAVARDASGNPLTGRTAAWTSSAPNVATVGGTSGLVTALSAGATTITATVEGRSATVQVAVTPVPVASVSVTLAISTLVPGQSTQATATTRDATGNILTGRQVSWSSSNLAVATVNASTGVVTGVGAGNASIVATSEGLNGLAAVNVVVAPVATVTVSLGATTINSGATTQATAVLRDINGTTLTGRVVSFSSSNPTVATVNPSTGLVTGVSAGANGGPITVTITATSEGRSGSATLAVTSPVASVTVTVPDSVLFVGGRTTQATALLRDSTGVPLTGRVVSWTSSNPSVATVSASGVVTPLAQGTVQITATSEGRSGSVTITVFLGF